MYSYFVFRPFSHRQSPALDASAPSQPSLPHVSAREVAISLLSRTSSLLFPHVYILNVSLPFPTFPSCRLLAVIMSRWRPNEVYRPHGPLSRRSIWCFPKALLVHLSSIMRVSVIVHTNDRIIRPHKNMLSCFVLFFCLFLFNDTPSLLLLEAGAITARSCTSFSRPSH